MCVAELDTMLAMEAKAKPELDDALKNEMRCFSSFQFHEQNEGQRRRGACLHNVSSWLFCSDGTIDDAIPLSWGADDGINSVSSNTFLPGDITVCSVNLILFGSNVHENDFFVYKKLETKYWYHISYAGVSSILEYTPSSVCTWSSDNDVLQHHRSTSSPFSVLYILDSVNMNSMLILAFKFQRRRLSRSQGNLHVPGTRSTWVSYAVDSVDPFHLLQKCACIHAQSEVKIRPIHCIDRDKVWGTIFGGTRIYFTLSGETVDRSARKGWPHG